MPELPEVETTLRGLEPHLVGQRIKAVKLRRKNLRIPFPTKFRKRLEGAHITKLTRRAKYILAHLDTGEIWITHLGMSGSLVFRNEPPRTHDHVILTLENGLTLAYHDPRRFGLMTLTNDISTHKLFAHLGPEPLEKTLLALICIRKSPPNR